VAIVGRARAAAAKATPQPPQPGWPSASAIAEHVRFRAAGGPGTGSRTTFRAADVVVVPSYNESFGPGRDQRRRPCAAPRWSPPRWAVSARPCGTASPACWSPATTPADIRGRPAARLLGPIPPHGPVWVKRLGGNAAQFGWGETAQWRAPREVYRRGAGRSQRADRRRGARRVSSKNRERACERTNRIQPECAPPSRRRGDRMTENGAGALFERPARRGDREGAWPRPKPTSSVPPTAHYVVALARHPAKLSNRMLACCYGDHKRLSVKRVSFVVRFRRRGTTRASSRWLLERNAKLAGIAFAIDHLGDVYLVGRTARSPPVTQPSRVEPACSAPCSSAADSSLQPPSSNSASPGPPSGAKWEWAAQARRTDVQPRRLRASTTPRHPATPTTALG